MTAFDDLAADYDQDFTDTGLGRALRNRVWQQLDTWIQPGQHLLDLGCGSGEDACHLAKAGVQVTSIDASEGMVQAARRKNAGFGEQVQVHHLAFEALVGTEHVLGPFDGAISNFGALNCARSLPDVFRAIATRLQPGGFFLACLMGPVVPWEWLWMIRRGQFRQSFRRMRRGGVDWRGLHVEYPSIGRIKKICPPELKFLRVRAVGAFLPPTYFEAWTRRHPKLLKFLERAENRLGSVPPFPQIADHYLVEFQRV